MANNEPQPVPEPALLPNMKLQEHRCDRRDEPQAIFDGFQEKDFHNDSEAWKSY